MTGLGLRAALSLAALVAATRVLAQERSSADPDRISRDTFESWMATLSNAGRWGAEDELGTLNLITTAWLKVRGVAALGSDVVNEVYPSVVPGIGEPLHQLALVALGMPLFDNLDLEALASEAAARSRFEFLFVAAPLRVRGGSGSPLNPLAVF